MNEILDVEITNLLKKHNIPLEFNEILVDDATRMTLCDENDTYKKLIFCSNDDGKLFAITRCIEKIKRSNPLYAKALDEPGCIEYVNAKSKESKVERVQVIDLDNMDIEEERIKCILRYSNSFLSNKLSIFLLDIDIDEMSVYYSKLDEIDERMEKIKKKLSEYKFKVTQFKSGFMANVFKKKTIAMYERSIRGYEEELNKLNELHKQEKKACNLADDLVIPRKQKIQNLTRYNSIIPKSFADLLQKYQISPEEIKNKSKSYGISEIPQELFTKLTNEFDKVYEERE